MIEVNDLTMRYGNFVALDKASFSVREGEVVGLLGPNGAGKSTTMKILTSYLHPSGGTATVGGKSVTEEPIEIRKLIGYLPEVLPLYMSMEVGEYLTFVGQARGLRGARLKERMKWVLDRCGLRPMFRKPVSELSKGYKQRTGLAQALIHDPAVVILDEPTSGLDPHQIQEIRGLVRELAAKKTVILSTHILQEAEAMADRIIIINRGKIVGKGTLDNLRKMAQEESRVYFAARAAKTDLDKALGEIDSIGVRKLLSEEKGVCRFELVGADEKAVIANVGMMALKKEYQVMELTAKPYSLEETFLTLTEAETVTVGEGKR